MAKVARYSNIDALARTVPVFPLQGVLLLPRATLPLNIFEPRYLQMFDDILSGPRLVCIVQPVREAARDPADAQESPHGKAIALRQTGCVGRLTAYQEQDDGRLVVQLTGVARCALVSEVETPRLYRIVSVDYAAFAHDLKAGDGADAVDRPALLSTLKRFLEARKLKADWASIERSETEQLVNGLSIMSPYGPEEKQALLEAKDLVTRANLLVALAEMEIAAGKSSGGSGTRLQ